MLTPKVNYLNNKDMLSEIHKSKSSYCKFTDPAFHQYDLILSSLDKINIRTIAEAKRNQAKRLGDLDYTKRKSLGEKIKLTDCEVNYKTIPKESIVFRIMTYDHIPLNSIRKKNPKTEADRREKVNFPPFQHWKFIDDELVCVGKSHWKGDLETGCFDKTTGQITDNLARMMIKLCERYATRGNVRGYCVDTETEALTKRGWLSIDEITEDDTILSYTNNDLTWSSIKSIYRGDYNGLMHHITSRSVDFFITPEHKIVTANGLVKAEHLKQSDQVIVMGNAVSAPTDETYSDAFVELVGQSITSTGISEVLEVLTNNMLDMEFILKLTANQRELLITRILESNIRNVSKDFIGMFQILAGLTGRRSNQYLEVFSKHGNKVLGNCLYYNGLLKTNDEDNVPTVPYNGRVWCPETEYGCFVARRNGKVHLTGNTYNDEMRGQAILQLTQIGLQFDESKSDNPFAYYTSSVINSFVRVINIEKRNQNIRDDILEMNGMNPSYTRTGSEEYEVSMKRSEDYE